MVYVVQEPAPKKNHETGAVTTIDVTPAAKFGPFQVLLGPGDVVLSTAPTIAILREKLRTFCDEDYLLMIGDPVAIALAAMVASDVNFGRVKFLRWAKREFDYVPVQAAIFGPLRGN